MAEESKEKNKHPDLYKYIWDHANALADSRHYYDKDMRNSQGSLALEDADEYGEIERLPFYKLEWNGKKYVPKLCYDPLGDMLPYIFCGSGLLTLVAFLIQWILERYL